MLRTVTLPWAAPALRVGLCSTLRHGVAPPQVTESLLTKLRTTFIDSYFPSDYIVPGHLYYNKGSPARSLPMPTYVSGSEMTFTVIGQNLGLGSGQLPPLRVGTPIIIDQQLSTIGHN